MPRYGPRREVVYHRQTNYRPPMTKAVYAVPVYRQPDARAIQDARQGVRALQLQVEEWERDKDDLIRRAHTAGIGR